MNKKNDKKNKHLTLSDRETIERGLKDGLTFRAISKEIGKDPSTVSKEVLRHITVSQTTVNVINHFGASIPPQPCERLLRPPYVCYPCKHYRKRCSHDKQFYNARNAQKAYEELLSESRQGIPLNKESFYEIDRILSERVKQGQHIYHILQTEDLGVSKSTVYRHLHKGYLSISAFDTPRILKFKPRKKAYIQRIPKALKQGRTYDDFLNFISDNKLSCWVEMDTVIGEIGGKTIMTFDFTFCNFMFGLLLDDKTSASASSAIKNLKERLLLDSISFGDVFPVILTDNGGEFSDVFAFENDQNGTHETSLFFCDPMRSSQKPRVEKNHTMFRDIIPKGESFDTFSQDTVNLIFSHVNGVKRKILNGKSPYEMFSFAFGQRLAHLLGIDPIKAADVIQSTKLQTTDAFLKTLMKKQK